ncbi:hypothetical protein AcW1_005687 [Taiwanofungus camphoratus]|nr:hypothetical protein AcW2_004450 [Antrodia cinnamomea]KAI0957228.1 hypothetical protein AcW1_005687 [Antrodia cinnamomea]
MNELTENPFASTHSLDANPFDDPSVEHISPTSSFAKNDHTVQLEELNQRERDLERREQELHQKAEHIRRFGRSNWPPFYPLIFHSIQDEIPEPSRSLITRLYQLWLVLFGTLVINMVACIFVLTSGSRDGGSDLGSSIGYLLVIAPLSFLLWYRPIYNGYMKEQALYYCMSFSCCSVCPLTVDLDLFFVFCGFHLLYSIYMIIGIPSTGSAGLIQTIRMFSIKAPVAAILGTIATVGWVVQGVGIALCYYQASCVAMSKQTHIDMH